MNDIQPEILEKLKNQNPLIILKYLLQGREWEHDGIVYVLSDDYELCTIAWEFQEGRNLRDGKPHYLKTGMTLQYFLKMAIDTSIDETAALSMGMVLSEKSRTHNEM